jgi:hypothetical protein
MDKVAVFFDMDHTVSWNNAGLTSVQFARSQGMVPVGSLLLGMIMNNQWMILDFKRESAFWTPASGWVQGKLPARIGSQPLLGDGGSVRHHGLESCQMMLASLNRVRKDFTGSNSLCAQKVLYSVPSKRDLVK